MRAAEYIVSGGTAAFPTETVYGLGADGFNPSACAKIFAIKRRPRFDPLILHASSAETAGKLFSSVPEAARKLMLCFWPGPLTLVLPKSEKVPDIVSSGLATVAVRVPRNPVAQKLIKYAGRPIAAPSANSFGRLSPTTAAHVYEQLGDKPDMILDGGPASVGVESTIITFIGGSPVLLRPGGLALEKIEAAIGKVKTNINLDPDKPLAPGGLKKHYAPKVKLIIFSEEGEIPESCGKTAVVTFRYPARRHYYINAVLSEKGDLEEAASNLFSVLHEIEDAAPDVIYAEKVPTTTLGLAIMDRLRRAAASK